MNYLLIELQLFTLVLVNFAVILIANIYSQPIKEIIYKRLFTSEFISKHYYLIN